jgi:hypothetical protein
VIDLETNTVVKSDGKKKLSKREKEEALRKAKENMK